MADCGGISAMEFLTAGYSASLSACAKHFLETCICNYNSEFLDAVDMDSYRDEDFDVDF